MESVCSIEGCDGTGRLVRGWCFAHYMRWRTTGDTGPAKVKRRTRGRKCSLDGCERKHQGRGFCDTHLQRFLKYGDAGSAEIEPRNPGAECSIAECASPAAGRGWCEKHYQRWRKTGDPLTPKGEHGAQWIGDAANYDTVHQRVRRARGRAKEYACAECGEAANHWAYDHKDPAERWCLKYRRPFSLDLSHYLPMCVTCHRRFDVQHMPRIECKIEGCERPQKARALCSKHYDRVRKSGAFRTADTAL